MEWAAGNLLKLVLGLRRTRRSSAQGALQKLDSLAKAGTADKNKAGRSQAVGRRFGHGAARNDLVIKASFQGEANVDVKVKEPTRRCVLVMSDPR